MCRKNKNERLGYIPAEQFEICRFVVICLIETLDEYRFGKTKITLGIEI